MFDKCFKVDEENILTPLLHSVIEVHFDTKMLKIDKENYLSRG